MNVVEKFYDEIYGEWDRLEKHPTEFELTMRALERYIPRGASVLDVGGGPGRYSIALAKRGHDVTLVDLSSVNVSMALEKAAEAGVEITALHGNALELEALLGSKKFDAVLLMGPLYHLTGEGDRVRAVKQALGRLNNGGVIAASFISSFAAVLEVLRNRPQDILSQDERVEANGFNERINLPEQGFTSAFFIDPLNVCPFMEGLGLETLRFMTAESLGGGLYERQLAEQPNDVRNRWYDFIYEHADDPRIIGFSEHLLYVGRVEAV